MIDNEDIDLKEDNKFLQQSSNPNNIIKGFGQQTSKTVNQAQHDERDIADPTEGFNIKKGEKKEDDLEDQKESVSGVEVDEQSVSSKIPSEGETKSQNEEKKTSHSQSGNDLDENENVVSSEPVAKKKTGEDEEDELEKEQIAGLDLDNPKVNESVSDSIIKDVIGTGGRSKKSDAHLQIDSIVGKQKRENLSNGQEVVSLDIDKQKFLDTKPDKDGNLKISLYNPAYTDEKDNFARSVITIPRHVVATLPTDENGRIKLLVSEQNVGQESKLDVHVDSVEQRNKLIEKNGNLLGEKSDLLKEKILDQPLKQGGFGYPMDVKGKDLVSNMSESKQNEVKALDADGVKKMLDAPENKKAYGDYLSRYDEKLAEKMTSGEVKLQGATKEGEVVDISNVKLDKENDSLSYNIGQEKVSTPIEDLTSNLEVPPKEHEKIKNEVLNEIGKEINVNPVSQSQTISENSKKGITGEVVDFGNAPYQHNKENQGSYFVKLKDENNVEKVVWGKELEDHINSKDVKIGDKLNIENKGKEPVTISVPVKDDDGKILNYEEKSALRNNFNVSKVEVEKEKIMETQITPETKYKDYHEKMSVDEQGSINKKNVSELQKEIEDKSPELSKNEHQLKGGGEIKKDGSVDDLTASEKLTKAIYKNDEKMVEKLMENPKNGVGKEHLKLMREMKDSDMPLSPKIETEIKSSVNAQSQKSGISM